MTEPYPPFPEPLEDDDDDVAWALQTAKVQWTRGGQADAIVWLKRAVDSADQLGQVWRANDLRRMTDDLAAALARPTRRPPAPLPRFEPGDQLVDDLLNAHDDNSVTAVPPPIAQRSSLPPGRSSLPPIGSPLPPPPLRSSIPPARSSLPPAAPVRTPPVTAQTPMRSSLPAGRSSLPPARGTLPPLGSSLPPPPVRSSLPPPPTTHSSYAPVDDAEFEEDIVLEDDVDDDAPELEVASARESAVSLRDSEFELRASAVELREEIELRDSEVELSDEVAIIDDQELEDDDEIEDDALDVPAPARHRYDSEELPTQPHIDQDRFPLSLLGASLPTPPAPAPLAPPASAPRASAPRASAPLPVDPDPHVADVLLGEVRGLEDVPPEGQTILAREARVERLNEDEEISSFGLALVVRGSVKVMPAIADLACARVGKGDIVWSEGNLDDGVVLRLVAGEDATEVAVWDAELLKSSVRDYPWVVEDLKALADRFQALAGVAMGPMGERLDDSLRAMVTDRCEVKRLLPNELLTTKGKPVGGMYIMAAGRLEIMAGNEVESELGPGDFLFGAQVLSNGAAPADSRAGKGGALVLFAPRSIAHDLLLSVPPLLEIFAS